MRKFSQYTYVLLSIISINSHALSINLRGDLGLNNLITQSTESMNWANSSGSTQNQFAATAFNAGASIGLFYYFSSFYVGPRVGFTFLNQSALSDTRGTYLNDSFYDGDRIELNHFFDLTAEIGYLLNEKAELYVAIGAANGSFNLEQMYKYTFQSDQTVVNNKANLWGFDLDVGLKTYITKRVSVNLGVQNVLFPKRRYQEIHGEPNDFINDKSNLLLAKLGLAYRFD